MVRRFGSASFLYQKMEVILHKLPKQFNIRPASMFLVQTCHRQNMILMKTE